MSASDRAILVATAAMPEAALSALRAAALRADAEVVLWDGEESAASHAVPSLVVGALRAGERRIPPRLFELAVRHAPMVQLLLLCNEPLVRASVTLRDGQVTLLGTPLDEARLYSHLRMLLADGDGRSLTPAGLASERRRAPWWGADLAPAVAFAERDDGFTGIVPLEGASASVHDAQRVRSLLRAPPGGEEASELEGLLSHRAGAVHLTHDGREWVVYWPIAEQPLWLFSPRRLPNLSDLAVRSAAAPHHVVRIAAASGDLAVALSTHPIGDRDFAAAVRCGGPALLDEIEARLKASGGRAHGVIVEVR